MGSNRQVSASYRCDKCNRAIKVNEYTMTLTTLHNCTITMDCSGTLHKILNIGESNRAKAIPDSLPGIENWIQRRLVYNHVQRFVSDEWTIPHNLQTMPSVYVYVREEGDANDEYSEQILPDDIELVDQNTIKVHFNQPKAGLAQCVTLISQLHADEDIDDESTNWIQVSNRGVVTVGMNEVLLGADIKVTLRPSNNPKESQVIEYQDVRNVVQGQSAWYSTTNVEFGNMSLPLGSFSLMTPAVGTSYMQDNRYNILYVEFDGIPETMRTDIILISRPPFTFADRIYDEYIDLSFMSPDSRDMIIRGGELYINANSEMIRTMYPPFIVT